MVDGGGERILEKTHKQSIVSPMGKNSNVLLISMTAHFIVQIKSVKNWKFNASQKTENYAKTITTTTNKKTNVLTSTVQRIRKETHIDDKLQEQDFFNQQNTTRLV